MNIVVCEVTRVLGHVEGVHTHVCELCAMSVMIQCCQIPCTKSVVCAGRQDFLPVRGHYAFHTYVGVCTHAMGTALALSLAQRTGKVMRSRQGGSKGAGTSMPGSLYWRKHSVTLAEVWFFSEHE